MAKAILDYFAAAPDAMKGMLDLEERDARSREGREER